MKLYIIPADTGCWSLLFFDNLLLSSCLGAYLSLSRNISKVDKYLASKGVVELNLESPDMELRDSLLQDYIDVIGRISESNVANGLWWATDMASKNRFVSPLPELLGDFVQSVRAIEHCESESLNLCVTGGSWPLVVGLQVYAESKNIQVQVLAFPGARWCYRVKGKARIWGGLLKACLLAVSNILKAHKAFTPDSVAIEKNIPVYLVKSFVYPGSFSEDGGYRDPFFGDLPIILQRKLGNAIQVVTMSLGFTDKYHCYQRMKQIKGSIVVPLEAYLRLQDVARALVNISRHLLFHPFQLPDAMPFLDADVLPLLQESLAADGGRIAFFQYLHFYASARFARQYKPLVCLITYEGNPWEKCFIQGLRTSRSNTPVVIGYQHSVVPQAAAGMFLSKKERWIAPHLDKVVATGERTADILKKYSAFHDDAILPSFALRYRYLYELDTLQRRSPASGEFTVLVALEGVRDVICLLSYAIAQAELLRDVCFLVRSHPVFPLDKLLALLEKKRKDLPQNLRVSDGDSVSVDIAACDAVLYWGTTVAVEALMMGRPVIHYDRGDWLSYDPLFKFEGFKWRVDRISALDVVLSQIRELPEMEYAERCAAGKNYVCGYLSAESEMSVMNFLPEVLQCAKVHLKDSNT